MSVHGNGKDTREWVVKDRASGETLASGYGDYETARNEARRYTNAQAVTK